jgi:hypothetical protein
VSPREKTSHDNMCGYEVWADRSEVLRSLTAIGDGAEWHCIPDSETLENRAYFWRSEPVGKAGWADLAQYRSERVRASIYFPVGSPTVRSVTWPCQSCCAR